MPQKIITATVPATSSVKKIAGITGLMLGASAAIAAILTLFFVR